MHTNNQNQKPGYISYPSRVKINQIDPRLDIFWREDLARVFAALSAEERDSIAQQLLPAKHIAWDKASNSFRYVAKATPFKNQINNCSHGRLRQLA